MLLNGISWQLAERQKTKTKLSEAQRKLFLSPYLENCNDDCDAVNAVKEYWSFDDDVNNCRDDGVTNEKQCKRKMNTCFGGSADLRRGIERNDKMTKNTLWVESL